MENNKGSGKIEGSSGRNEESGNIDDLRYDLSQKRGAIKATYIVEC